MKVTNEIKACRKEEWEAKDMVTVNIGSHWNQDNIFEMLIDGESYWFRREEVEKAIRNACNH